VGILDKTTNVGMILVYGAAIADIAYRTLGPRSLDHNPTMVRALGVPPGTLKIVGTPLTLTSDNS
jgi:hypothetical protein